MSKSLILGFQWYRVEYIENRCQVASASQPKQLVAKTDIRNAMKQNREDYSEQHQESNPRLFGGFTFYGETPEVSGTEDSSKETQPGVAEGKSLPLAMASVGEKLRIVKLKGSEGTVRRLIGMGLVPSIEVQIVSTSGGSVIVAIGDNRIGLGAGMAQKIMCTNSKFP